MMEDRQFWLFFATFTDCKATLKEESKRLRKKQKKLSTKNDPLPSTTPHPMPTELKTCWSLCFVEKFLSRQLMTTELTKKPFFTVTMRGRVRIKTSGPIFSRVKKRLTHTHTSLSTSTSSLKGERSSFLQVNEDAICACFRFAGSRLGDFDGCRIWTFRPTSL